MCYSDHNEDIRTKGNCDYCGSDSPNEVTGYEWPDIRGLFG